MVPVEFTPDYILANSPVDEQLYTAFLKSGEPYRSLYQHNFHMAAREGYGHDPALLQDRTPPGLDLEDESVYYNTSGEASAYWSRFDLPKPTRCIRQLRADLREWGYCLIADALSSDQYKRLKQRLTEQAEAERKAGIACWTGAAPAPGEPLPRVQFLHSLVNKGEQFIQCVEHDPAGVQGGPVIEQLLNETMGNNFLMSSFIAIISNRFNMPQGLHQDQAIAPFQETVAPYTVNTMYIMDDMTAHNGGTLVVPGSHKLVSAAGSGNPVTEPLPPAINLAAPAGTVMVFEGRLLHGTGVNRSNASRSIMVMNSVKPFMRQQELHMLSVRSDILKNASPKLLYRLGALPTGLGGVEGAWHEYLVNHRLALESGRYEPVGALSPADVEALDAPFTYRESLVARRQFAHQPETLPAIRAQYERLEPAWSAPGERFPPNRR
ncbi:MAG: phytanoyl-CoA dioxygenase family protein [Pseudomonadota bacterium]